jgi:hypothetical protein
VDQRQGPRRLKARLGELAHNASRPAKTKTKIGVFYRFENDFIFSKLKFQSS